MEVHIKEATDDPAKQLWLEQHLFPFGAPYHSKDGTLILPMATFNRSIFYTPSLGYKGHDLQGSLVKILTEIRDSFALN